MGNEPNEEPDANASPNKSFIYVTLSTFEFWMLTQQNTAPFKQFLTP